MAENTEVFKRREQKYRLGPNVLAAVMGPVREHMAPGEFGLSRISSLYYDTPEFELIERSLDKPIYKEKLRLRVYGEPSPESTAFVEIKKKFKGVVYKRRVPMSLAAAEAYLAGMPYLDACDRFPLPDATSAAQSVSPLSVQISREIDFMRSRHEGLFPSMLIRCDREAFADPGGSELRVTVDSSLTAVRSPADIRGGGIVEEIIPAGEAIMEIKNAGPIPLWLSETLSSAEAYPQSFSKYGTAYMNGKVKKGEEKCSTLLSPRFSEALTRSSAA